MIRYLLVLVCLFSSFVGAVEPTADESKDASSLVLQALASAKVSKVPVIVIFGANWCEDCRVLEGELKSASNVERMAKEFRIVKVNVGDFDQNLLLSMAYGNPIQNGIPAVVVLSPDNQVLYTARSGELSVARRKGGIYDFFKNVTQTARYGR